MERAVAGDAEDDPDLRGNRGGHRSGADRHRQAGDRDRGDHQDPADAGERVHVPDGSGLVIAAIAAAIAIGVLLYKNWDKIKEKAGKLKEHVVGAFKDLKENVKRLFKDIKDAMVAPIEAARDLIKGIIKKIKGFFDFDFKLPDLKTPHFTIDPPGWSIGDLLHGVIPSLDVDWYAKGGIFRSPSVIGVGEAGPEAVLPIDKLQEMLARMADSIVNGILTGNQLQAAGTGGEIVIKNYLYPSGPQLGETIVNTYDRYKRILG